MAQAVRLGDRSGFGSPPAKGASSQANLKGARLTLTRTAA
jgi:hypothetical protein